jgi:hypothetical protein
MKSLIAAALVVLAGLPARAQEAPKSRVDIVFCVDRSGSMQQVIDTAKQKVWGIVNEVSKSKPTPVLRIGLIGYGSGDRDIKLFPLSDDLEKVYENLMTFKVDMGGDEWVGWAAKKAAEEMLWSKEAKSVKIIFMVGNETAAQGRPEVLYTKTVPEIIKKDISVNAIYCGRPSAEEERTWREVASLADGSYTQIDLSGGAVTVATPMDKELMELSQKLNGTYVEFGRVGAEKKENQARQDANAFVEPLWARRRIGYLLDEIRLNGEHKELVDEVVRLSRDFGIQTPYTSFLILEDGTPATGGAMSRKLEAKLKEMAPQPAETDRAAAAEHNDAAKSLEQGFKGRDGKAAVDTAEALRRLRDAERDEAKLVPSRKAAGTRFLAFRNLWVDERLTDAHAITTVKFGSAAYFRLIEKRPELVASLKLGMVVLVTAPGKALAVAEAGDEKLTDEQIEALFR